MTFPHTVRLDGPDGSLMVTRQAKSLVFRSDVDGGFDGGSFVLKRPIDQEALDLFTDVLIFDRITGKQVGGGRLLTPGRTNGDAGQVANVKFTGEGKASMSDVEKPHTFIDDDISNWDVTSRTTRRLSAASGTPPNSSSDDTALILDPTDDKTIAVNAELVMTNKMLVRSGQKLGGFCFEEKSGINNSLWRTRGRAYAADLSSFVTAIDDAWSTSLSARRKMTVNGDFSDRAVASVSWKRLTSTDAPDEDTWSSVRAPRVRALIHGQDRNPRTTGYTNEYIYAHEAFVDWVAQYCPRLDIENADIAQGTYQFDQLSWSAVNGNTMLAELLEYEPGLMWGAYEKQVNGRWRVALQVKPTDIRYELSVDDGYDDPSPGNELANVIWVNWTSPNGKPQTTRVPSTGTATVPGIPAGITQSRVLDLGSDVGSTSQAIARGQAELAQRRIVPNGGTLTVGGGRKVWDRYTETWVRAWEIVPGYLGSVRGVSPRVDTLNPVDGPDGSTISRIVSMTWSDAAGAATLELDTYTLTVKRKIVDLVRQIKRRPR